jgi:Raf kinase inhibitor-like YbhB/YbcL family protein
MKLLRVIYFAKTKRTNSAEVESSEVPAMSRLKLIFALLLVSGIAQAGTLQLQVDAGGAQHHVRKHFVYSGCGGDNISPAMHWQGAPHGTKSYALTVFDPDAGHGKGWWHWMVIDLPATTQALAENATLPKQAINLRNDFGNTHWDGPCPPAGDQPHHYVFTLYALDTAHLDIHPDMPPAQALRVVRKHTLAKAAITFTYGR